MSCLLAVTKGLCHSVVRELSGGGHVRSIVSCQEGVISIG